LTALIAQLAMFPSKVANCLNVQKNVKIA